MPSPYSTATARPDLGFSFMEMQPDMLREGFVGTRVFPIFETPRQAGSFKRVTVGSLLESIDTRRAPGGAYNRSRWQFEEDAYATTEHGEEEPIDDRDAANYGDYFEIELIATARARRAVMHTHEVRVRDAVRSAPNSAAGSNWSDYANATPVSDIEAAVRALRARGIIANQVVMSWLDYRDVRMCDQVKDALAGQGAGTPSEPGSISATVLARLFSVDEVVVAEGLENSANANKEAIITDIWTPGTVSVTRAARTRDLAEPSAGRTMLWTGDGAVADGLIEEYRDETVRSNIIRCRFESDEKLLYPNAVENITGTQG